MDKQQELLDLLSKAYNDPKINEYEGLKDKLFECAKRLTTNETNVGEVCYKLSTINSEYLARHHFEMPESIIELQKFVTKEGQNIEDGRLSLFGVKQSFF